MGQVQPSPAMIQDETYERGEYVLPRLEGSWTLFAANRIYRKLDGPSPSTVGEVVPGREAPYAVQVTWIAADDEAFAITYKRFAAEQAEAERRQQQRLVKPASNLVI